MLEAHDEEHQEELETVEIIPISSKGVSPLAFNLSKEEKQMLFESGQEAAQEYFDGLNSSKCNNEQRYKKLRENL